MTTTTEKEDSKYKDRFREFEFIPIFEFADSRRLNYTDLDEDGLCALVSQRYPAYEICYDEEEVLGVKIGQHAGGAYKVREGVSTHSKFRNKRDPRGERGCQGNLWCNV